VHEYFTLIKEKVGGHVNNEDCERGVMIKIHLLIFCPPPRLSLSASSVYPVKI